MDDRWQSACRGSSCPAISSVKGERWRPCTAPLSSQMRTLTSTRSLTVAPYCCQEAVHPDPCVSFSFVRQRSPCVQPSSLFGIQSMNATCQSIRYPLEPGRCKEAISAVAPDCLAACAISLEKLGSKEWLRAPADLGGKSSPTCANADRGLPSLQLSLKYDSCCTTACNCR